MHIWPWSNQSRFPRLMFPSRTALVRSSTTRPLLHTKYWYLQLIVYLRKCIDWFSVCNLSTSQFFVNMRWNTETFWTFTLFTPRSYGGAPWGGLYLLQQFWSRIKNKLHKNTKFLNAECYLSNLQNTSESFYHYYFELFCLLYWRPPGEVAQRPLPWAPPFSQTSVRRMRTHWALLAAHPIVFSQTTQTKQSGSEFNQPNAMRVEKWTALIASEFSSLCYLAS